MKEGEWRFALTGGRGGRLFHKWSGIMHEFWAGEPLFADGSNKMHDGSVLNAYDVEISSSLTVTGVVDIIHTATEPDDHALELDVDAAGFGDVKAIDISYVTGAIADGQDEGIILLNIDESLATGGGVFAVEVLATEGSALIWGLKAAALVGPIHQDSGVFTDMDSALVKAVDKLTAFTTSDPGGANNVSIFVADNDTVTIGNAAKFEELEFLLETVASGAGIKPTFEFSDGASPTTWDTFTPVDGTNGMRNTGVIAWDDVDIPSWVVDGNSEYLIRITRTRNSLSTVPVEDKVQIASTTTYTWDQSGDVYIRNLGRDADNLLDFDTDNKITFRVGAADRGAWTTTGLGIGTVAPEKILEIRSSSPIFRLRDTGATANATTAFIEFGGTDAGVWSRTGYVGDGSSATTDISLRAEISDLHLGDSSSATTMVLQGGNVGIGLTEIDANYKFIVRRAANVNFGIGLQGTELALTAFNDAISANVPMRFYASEYNFINGNVGIGVVDPDTMVEIYKVGTQLKLSGGAADYATFAVSADGLMTITTVDSGAALGHIALMPDGNVGINIAIPLAKLHIDQASTTAAIPVLTLDQADISDGFINFIGSDRGVITGATNSLESVRVEIGGVVRRIALYVDA